MNITNGTAYLLAGEDGSFIKATDKREDVIDEAVSYIKNDGGEPTAYEVTIDDEEWNILRIPWKDIALQLAEQD